MRGISVEVRVQVCFHSEARARCCVLIGRDARSRSRSRRGAAAAPHTAAHFFFSTHYGDHFPSHLSSLARRLRRLAGARYQPFTIELFKSFQDIS